MAHADFFELPPFILSAIRERNAEETRDTMSRLSLNEGPFATGLRDKNDNQLPYASAMLLDENKGEDSTFDSEMNEDEEEIEPVLSKLFCNNSRLLSSGVFLSNAINYLISETTKDLGEHRCRLNWSSLAEVAVVT